MIKILKFLLSLIFLAIIVFVVLYFLPAATKEKILTTLAGVVPESLKDKAEELILTPPEQRSRVIRELEDRLTRLRTGPSKTETAKIIQESETLISELKEKNEAASLTEIVANRIVNQLLDQTATSTLECPMN